MENETLSLVITTPTNGAFLDRIVWNSDEFKERIASIMAQYEGVIFTEDEMKEAKAERAKLNAMKKAIAERRIMIKNEIMAPYQQFEREVSEVVSLIDGPIATIDKQIKAYDERRKEEKRASLAAHYTSIAGDLERVIPFSMVFDLRYLNSTVPLKKAANDITMKVVKIRDDLKVIDGIEEEYRLTAKTCYYESLNLRDALNRVNMMKAVKNTEEQMKPAQSEAKKPEPPAPAVEKPQEPAATPESKSTPSPAPEPSLEPPKEPEKEYYTTFTAYGTKAQLIALRKYMVDNKIRFEKGGRS